MRIGVVCEGSNDFLAMRETVLQLAAEKGIVIAAFDALQPKVDATSGRQIGGGGWTRVKVWLEDNAGAELEKVLNAQLFSVSAPYDLLIIHLDGDVVWLSADFSPLTRANCFSNPQLVVSEIEKYIEGKLQVPGSLDDQILYAVPVMHTEAWLYAAARRGKSRRKIENHNLKDAVNRYLPYRYNAPIREAAQAAARDLAAQLPELRKELSSLEHFASKVDATLQ